MRSNGADCRMDGRATGVDRWTLGVRAPRITGPATRSSPEPKLGFLWDGGQRLCPLPRHCLLPVTDGDRASTVDTMEAGRPC